jgi:hypothetical protein
MVLSRKWGAAVTAVLAAAALAALAQPATASPASAKADNHALASAKQRVTDTTGILCDITSGPQMCMWADGTVGDPITQEPYTGIYGDNVFTRTSGSFCTGGVVTSTCPFTVGSGMNTQLEGDSLVWLSANGTVAAADDLFYATQRTATGDSGTEWVEATASHGGHYYINVYDSDYAYSQDGQLPNNPFAVCADGTAGDTLETESYNLYNGNGNCDWIFGAS